MKGIEDLNVRGVRTQGIVRDDGPIRMFTVWCRAAEYPGMGGNGKTRRVVGSFYRCVC